MKYLMTNAVGEVDRVHIDGFFARKKENNDKYQSFVAWFKGLNTVLNLADTFQANAHVFVETESLVEYCKEHGFMIHANPNSPRLADSGTEKWGTTVMVNIPKAVAASESENANNLDGIRGIWSHIWVPDDVAQQINEDLRVGTAEICFLTSRKIKRTFVYLDVSDFSKLLPGQEALVINSLVNIVRDPKWWNGVGTHVKERFEAMLCIGDGYIFVFVDAVDATLFGAYLAQLIELAVARRELPVEFHFRMGVHTGGVFTFWDPGRRHWNYIGEGINGGNRVLSAMGKDKDDAVFISGQTKDELYCQEDLPRSDASTILGQLQNRGRHKDKHKRPWRVYELNHTALCGNQMPVHLQK